MQVNSLNLQTLSNLVLGLQDILGQAEKARPEHKELMAYVQGRIAMVKALDVSNLVLNILRMNIDICDFSFLFYTYKR